MHLLTAKSRFLRSSTSTELDGVTGASTISNSSKSTIKRWSVYLHEQSSAEWNRDDPLRFDLVAADTPGCAEDEVVEGNRKGLYRLDTDLEIREVREKPIVEDAMAVKERANLSQTPWFGTMKGGVDRKVGKVRRFVMRMARLTRKLICI